MYSGSLEEKSLGIRHGSEGYDVAPLHTVHVFKELEAFCGRGLQGRLDSSGFIACCLPPMCRVDVKMSRKKLTIKWRMKKTTNRYIFMFIF